MARSSIQGTSPAPPQPAGRDTASLGPSDTSDSGSDMMGLADSDGGDPNAPADVDEQRSALLSPEALDSSGVAAGTGDSRSAGGDAGKGDGASGEYGTIQSEGVRETERLWLRYRDAWVAFAAARYPDTAADTWRAWLSRARARALSEIAGS